SAAGGATIPKAPQYCNNGQHYLNHHRHRHQNTKTSAISRLSSESDSKPSNSYSTTTATHAAGTYSSARAQDTIIPPVTFNDAQPQQQPFHEFEGLNLLETRAEEGSISTKTGNLDFIASGVAGNGSTGSRMESYAAPTASSPVKRQLLRESLFPPWEESQYGNAGDEETPERMQQDDPLGIKIWKISSLSQGKPSRPSGISQLRQHMEKGVDAQPQSEPMSLDDFIVPSSLDSPAHREQAPSTGANGSSHALASAIPIKSRKEDELPTGAVPASVPNPPQAFQHSNEFGYVQRRVRKTSVDERMSRKRPAEASPFVAPTNPIIPDLDTNLPDYSLDNTLVSPSVAFNLESFHLSDDPVLNTTGAFSQSMPFSPVDSPLVTNGQFQSMYTQPSIGSSLTTSADFFSPPPSGYQSTASTPQATFDNEHMMYFGDHDRQINSYSHRMNYPQPAARAAHFTFGTSVDTAYNNMQPASAQHGIYSNNYHVQPQQQHVDPTQVVARNTVVSLGGDGLFNPTNDVNNEDENNAFQSRSIGGVLSDFHSMEEPNADHSSHVQWSHPQNSMPSYPSHTRRQTLSGMGDDWDDGGSLGRGHGSAASVSDIRNRGGNDPRKQKMARTMSTPNVAQLMQGQMNAQSHHTSPNSPFDSAFNSRAPSRAA
ncbi:hypothetical protein KEM55_002770, partial [Ascosphaera atra]